MALRRISDAHARRTFRNRQENSGERVESSELKRYASVPTRTKVEVAAAWLEEKKARNILALQPGEPNMPMDAVVIATADNARHAQALADHIADMAKQQKFEFLGMEGYRHARWILVDLNDVVVHVFLEEARSFFNLEGLWPRAEKLLEQKTELRPKTE